MHKMILVLFLTVGLPVIGYSGQEEKPNPSQQEEQAIQIAEGTLTKVDVHELSFWIKTPEGKEMQFTYTPFTQVEGGGEPAGLAGMTGSDLKVHYKVDGSTNAAIRIEVQTRAS